MSGLLLAYGNSIFTRVHLSVSKVTLKVFKQFSQNLVWLWTAVTGRTH